MIKVECVSCKSPYDVDERRIPEKGMKMRCPKCNTSFMVARDGTTSEVPAAGGPATGVITGALSNAKLAPNPNPAPKAPLAPPPSAVFGSPLSAANNAPAPAQPPAAAVVAPRTATVLGPAAVAPAPGASVKTPVPAAPPPTAASPMAAGMNAPQPMAAGAFAAPVAAPSPFKKTLLGGTGGAKPAEPKPALAPDPKPLEPKLSLDPKPAAEAKAPKPNAMGFSAKGLEDSNGALADLPAVKPAPKPAVPWGSLAPPSMDASKSASRPAQPGAALPKGAMGVALNPPLQAAAAVAQAKAASSAGSAFGAGGGRQAAAGQARPKPESVIAPQTPRPEPTVAKAPIELPLIDLPAAKPVAAGSGFAASKPGAKPIAPELPLIDLPAAKVAPKFGAAVMTNLKPANTVTAEPEAEIGLDLGAELELDVGDGSDIDPAELDLPAPKAAIAIAPFSGAAASNAPQVDLPAPKPTAPGNKFGAPVARAPMPAPTPSEQPLVDLPAPRHVDLPAPKPGGRTVAGGFTPSKSARGSDGGLLGDLDKPGSPGFTDLPAPKGIIADLPAPKGSAANAAPGFTDLPAPKGIVDLPATRGIVDLPGPRGIADLPVAKGIADLPTPKGVTDLPSPKLGGAFGDLDLPVPKHGGGSDDEASFGDLELPDLPVRAGFGNIDLPAPRATADVVPPKAATYHGVGPTGGGEESSFGDLDLGGPEPDFTDIRPDDLLTLKEGNTSTPPALQDDMSEEVVEDYGEAGLLDDESEEDMEFGIAGAQEADDGFGLPPELVRRTKGEAAQAEDVARSKRALHVLLGVAAALVLLGGAGAALGMTDYGYFGMYFLEQYLPEAADARFAREAIERAEKTSATDTFRDVQHSLTLLGESRHKAGLNRELLTRSLLHEALFVVRFGPNATSSGHIAAILARLEERHGRAPGMDLARAADAARRSALPDAERYLSLASAQAPQDAYVGLLAGEVALRDGKLAEAEKAFADALKHGGSARAQWGLARVALSRTDANAQRVAVEETLKLSPLHAEARLAEARLLWNSGKQERALFELRQALGQEPVGEQFLTTSKPARANGYSLLGYVNESRGHLNVARKAYEDALSADPYLVEALLGAGRVLYRERRYSDALARFESALNLAQKSGGSIVLSGRRADVEARLGQGRALLALNRAPEAKATLAALMKDNPNDPEIVRAAGQTEDALGNKAMAEELLVKGVELAPTTFASYLALAQHYFKLNRADKASETLNEAATKVEENVEMRRMLGQSELARNRFDSAVHEFKRAVELDPQDLDAQFGLAVGYRKTAQLDQARELFDKIAARDPQFAGLALERGQLLEAQGDYAKAVETYKQARDKDPSDASINLRLGAAQVEAGKLEEADATLQAVMKQMPNSAEAEYFTGRLALARGRGPDALTHFDRALALDGAQAVYHLYAARAALEMTNLGRTLEEAEAALDRDASLGDAYWIRGIVRVRSGAVKDALKDARRALELHPSRYDAYALMAECYDELRQLPEAAAAYHSALEKDPERGEWWYKLGRLSLDSGAKSQAVEALQKAMTLGDKMDPRPYWLPDSYRLSGELARGAGNRKVAVALFKRYLKIAPDGALDRDDVRKLLLSWDIDLSED